MDWRKRMASFSGPVSRLRRRREMAAVTLFVSIALGSFALLRPTSETGAPSSSLARIFIGSQPDAGWVDDFARLAARARSSPVVLQEADVVSTAPMPDLQTAALPAPVPAASPAVSADDLLLKTSSVRPARGAPLLPPVPDADAFKVRKGDRLFNQPHPLQGASTDAVVAPHAMLAPVRQPRGNGLRLASAAMKPMDLAPRATPDAVFQGPPLPPPIRRSIRTRRCLAMPNRASTSMRRSARSSPSRHRTSAHGLRRRRKRPSPRSPSRSRRALPSVIAAITTAE